MRVSMLRRALAHCQRRSQHSEAGPPAPHQKPKSLKELDEETFGGLKSAKMLLSDEAQQRRSLVGRFDWHVVQFLLALIPPGVAFLIVQWARHDMKKMEEKLGREAILKESKKLEAIARHQQETQGAGASGGTQTGQTRGTPSSGEDMQQRISQLEELVRELQQQQASRAAQAQGPADSQQRQQEQRDAAPRQQQGHQQQQAQVPAPVARQQHSHSSPKSPSSEQQSKGQQQQQQLAGETKAGLLGSMWHWTSSKVASQPPKDAADVAGAAAAAPSSVNSGSRNRPGSSAPASQTAGGSNALAPAAATAIGELGVTAEEGTAAPGPRAPGNTANRLLHALGHPMRWLRRQGGDQPPRAA
ncbi:hypothetical protein ACK3TF_002563 [Chlorella vulgaris]